jgi:flagellar biogenesis protein FliO
MKLWMPSSRPAAALAAICLISAPAAAQRLGAGVAEPDIPVWRVLGALVICLMLAGGAAFALRKRLGGAVPAAKGRERRLQLVETLRLSHQIDVCLVRCGEDEFMIAATPHGASLIRAPAPAATDKTA